MQKYSIRDNIISALIGIAFGVILCIGATYERSCKDLSVKSVASIINPLMCDIEPIIEEEPEVIKSYVSLGKFTITAYCSCEICCPGTSDGITYTGTVATEGRTIAVDPEVIPLGSLLEIDGIEYVAEDIGGAIKGNRVDIHINSHEDALEFGVQEKEIFLIKLTQFR